MSFTSGFMSDGPLDSSGNERAREVHGMIWKGLKFVFHMVPTLWDCMRDLAWEELSLGEIRTHYLFGKANAYERAGLFKRAVRVYEEILVKEPVNIPVFLNLGGLYYRNEMYEAAIPYYEKVIRVNPKHYQGHYWLGMCYSKLDRFYAAINTLEEVIEYLPTFKDALNLMGECYEKIGEGAKAEHYYLKAIGTDPEGIVIHGALLGRDHSEKKREERIKH
jgi:tetratricopeptide (TPR) repeat protein